MNEFVLQIIILLHIVFVLFIVITPFIGNNYFLLLHFIIVPFMMLHWYVNDNNCALTLVEKSIRYKLYGKLPDPTECFTYRLIAPVYDFKKNNDDLSTFIYIVTIALWMYSATRLYLNYRNGKLSSLEDLMRY